MQFTECNFTSVIVCMALSQLQPLVGCRHQGETVLFFIISVSSGSRCTFFWSFLLCLHSLVHQLLLIFLLTLVTLRLFVHISFQFSLHQGSLTSCAPGSVSCSVILSSVETAIYLAPVKMKTNLYCFLPSWSSCTVRCLEKVKHSLSAQTYTDCQHGGGELMIWAPWCHWVDPKLLCMPKYSGGWCEPVCPTAKA